MVTLSQFIDITFLEVKRLSRRWRKDSTEPTSLYILNSHLKPTLGSKLIHLVTRRDLQALLNQKAEQYSYSVVQHLHSLMCEIFEMAAVDRLIPVNPAPSTVIPKCKAPKPKPTMNPEQIDAVAKLLTIRDRLMFWLASPGGGLRPSEVQGLKVDNVSLKVGTVKRGIDIRQRVYRGKEGPLKNRPSERTVPLVGRTKALMKEYLKSLADRSPNAWLFPSEKPEKSVSYSNVYRRYIKPALLKCGLVGINYQAMRRTFASQANASGMAAKTRADIMGHSVDVNVNVYTQADDKIKEKAMQKLEKRLLQQSLGSPRKLRLSVTEEERLRLAGAA
jgi:integrase